MHFPDSAIRHLHAYSILGLGIRHCRKPVGAVEGADNLGSIGGRSALCAERPHSPIPGLVRCTLQPYNERPYGRQYEANQCANLTAEAMFRLGHAV